MGNVAPEQSPLDLPNLSPQSVPEAPKANSPMLKQYLGYMERYPDCLILFQVGDFYEAFFDCAVTLSKTLNVTLTSRDKNNPDPIPMAGVPIGVIDAYVERLIDAGLSAALISQTSKPEAGKGMVSRALERIVTPGMRLLSHSGNSDSSNVVAAIGFGGSAELSEADEGLEFALAWSTVQSGKVFVRDGIGIRNLQEQITRIGPAELLFPQSLNGKAVDRRLSWIRRIETVLPQCALKFRRGIDQNTSGGRDLGAISGYGGLSKQGKASLLSLLDFVDETTVGTQVSFQSIEPADKQRVMGIDAVARRNLELVRNARDGATEGSLFQALDHTTTSPGKRLLREWILHPLIEKQEINARLDAVQSLIKGVEERGKLKRELQYIADIERIAARIDLLAVSPRELSELRTSLEKLPEIKIAIETALTKAPADYLRTISENLKSPQGLLENLQRALADSPALNCKEGEVIRDGFDAELDQYRSLKKDGKQWLAALELREREKTGISSLKVRFNQVFGFYIEITKANLSRVPENYHRKQTTVNGERFITEELKKMEQELLTAESRQLEREELLFQELRKAVVPAASNLRALAETLAKVDVLVSLATLSERYELIRPEITEGTELEIVDGRHPVLMQILGAKFIPNSIELGDGDKNFLMLTGPNMGGKSTYLRQIALIAIMAQMGSFVPAKKARVGIVDQVFARLGAHDNQLEGESTFMVEMREVGHIVEQATARSLVLIDEVGRGTATSDGLSIAQAIVEWILDKIGCRTLFATHFHELTSLDRLYSKITNHSVSSVDRGGEVYFTHEIREGAASRSYGIDVARLAGLPAEIIDRSRVLLVERAKDIKAEQLPMFSARLAQTADPRIAKTQGELDNLRGEIESFDVSSRTPLEASRFVDDLQRKLSKERESQ